MEYIHEQVKRETVKKVEPPFIERIIEITLDKPYTVPEGKVLRVYNAYLVSGDTAHIRCSLENKESKDDWCAEGERYRKKDKMNELLILTVKDLEYFKEIAHTLLHRMTIWQYVFKGREFRRQYDNCCAELARRITESKDVTEKEGT